MLGRRSLLSPLRAIAFALVLVLPAVQLPAADVTQIAGLIDRLHGGVADFEIVRGDQYVSAREFTQLHAGDRITVLGKDAWMRIYLVGGDDETLHFGDEAYRVPALGEESSAAGNFLERLAGLVGWWTDHRYQIVSARIKGREDGGPELPLFVHKRPVVAAGDRPFAVAWSGGTAPFRLRLVGEDDGAVAVTAEGLSESRRLPPRAVALAAGRYRLEVTDANGKTASVRFTAVDPAELPQPPGELQFDRLPTEMRTTATAAWLAGAEGGRWTLAALSLLATVADDYSPAEALRLALTVGEVGEF
jgi:hypothetical protein